MRIGEIEDIGDGVVASKQDHRGDGKHDHDELRGIILNALEAFHGDIDKDASSNSS